MIREKLIDVVRWIRNFTREKFHSQNENLSYHLAILISSIIFIIALNGFIELTDGLLENGLNGVDESVTRFVLSLRSHALTTFFIIITHLGDRDAYAVFITLLTAFFFIKHRSWKFISQTVIVMMLSTLSNIVLKRAINRSRPLIEHLVSVDSLSYPSGHSMSAMAFYGFLIYLLIRSGGPHWLRAAMIAVLAILIFSIGLSRIYLGVHFPTDVAAGFMGGLIWVTFCVILFNLIDLQRRRPKISRSKDARLAP